MIHYYCDRCRTLIAAEVENRYVLHMNIEAMAPSDDEPVADQEIDTLSKLHEALEGVEPHRLSEALLQHAGGANQHARFDLCPSCYRKFLSNPLGGIVTESQHFSHN